MLLFKTTSNKKKCTLEGKQRVAEAMYLMYIYGYNEVFFPNLLSYEKVNNELT